MLVSLLALAAAQSSPPLYFEPTFDRTAVVGDDRLITPTDAAAIPGDDRIFVTEEQGRVRIIRDGTLLSRPFIDIASLLPGRSNFTLAAITFHPQFSLNQFVYLWYDSRDLATPQNSLTLARVTVDPADPDLADPATWVELLSVPIDGGIHFGGRIAFAPDGLLWIGAGDGTSNPASMCISQDMAELAGKMIRIDVDAAFPYAIPPDNPFVGVAGAAPEIVHSGLRHPWKWTIDEATGDLWIGEIGGQSREEINFAAAGVFGLNYGWPADEGTACGTASGCPPTIPACGDPSYTAPIFEYSHGPGCAVTGGEVYSGSAAPWLVGWYVCADLCTNQMWRIRRTPQGTFEVREQPVVAEPPLSPAWSSVSFARDGFGELLFVEIGNGAQSGLVRRLRGTCAAERTCDGAVNSAGVDAKIRWIGSASIAANDASVFVTDLPPLSPSILFYGPLDDLIAMGNGTLCVGGTLVRGWVEVAGGNGRCQYDLDFGASPFNAPPGQIEPGSSWTFQAWYRDVGGPLGATYNFSGATRVTFCP